MRPGATSPPAAQLTSHDRARNLLSRALERGKLAHAYLIAGPEGAGKRTLALEFAAALVCETRSFPGCGACSACRRVRTGTHPDLTVLEPEKKMILIEQVRELNSRLHYHSFEGGVKTGVIPNAELMTEPAQNAFLKTLEEPPADTALILTATNLNRILPTIISRCQLLRLGPLPRHVIERLLRERRGLDNDNARLVAALARGDASRALDMELELMIEFRKTMLTRLFALDQDDRLAIMAFAQEMSKNSEQQDLLLELLTGFYLDALHLKLGSPELRNQDLADQLRSEAAHESLPRLLAKLEVVHQARTGISQSANPRLVWEVLTMFLTGAEGARIQTR